MSVFFLLYLFVTVMRQGIAPEFYHYMSLTPWEHSSSDEFEEVTIWISQDGLVHLNGIPKDFIESKTLPEFTQSLTSFRESADSIGDRLLILIETEELTRYERIVDVLDAMEQAGIEERFHLSVGS